MHISEATPNPLNVTGLKPKTCSAGPHPRPWHKDSLFGPGERVPLCRERRAVWKAKLKLHRRARRITPLFEDIGLAMLKRHGTDGRLDPTHQTLASDVECSVKSVQRAMAAFNVCGLLRWARRVVRHGWRVEQTSNAYVLMTEGPPVVSTLPRDGQQVLQTSFVDKSTKLTSLQQVLSIDPEAARAARAALAKRRAQVEEELRNRIGRKGR